MENLNVQNNTNEMMVGEGVGFERIRRITGYLVGTLEFPQFTEGCCLAERLPARESHTADQRVGTDLLEDFFGVGGIAALKIVGIVD